MKLFNLIKLLLTLLSCQFCICCNVKSLNTHINEPVEQLMIVWEIPQLIDGKVLMIDLSDSILYIKKEKINIYLAVNRNDSINLDGQEQNGKGNINLQTQNFRRVLAYYLFRDGDSIGIKYNLGEQVSSSPFIVDSFLRRKTFLDMEIWNTNNSLVKVEKKPDGSIFRETYVPIINEPNTVENPLFDSLYCYYSKDTFQSKISFSKILEERNKLKLVKVVYVFNERTSMAPHPVLFPKRQLKWLLAKKIYPFKATTDSIYKAFIKEGM